MGRPLRHAPPLPDRRVLLRPRLLERLHGRFSRPLTAVVAPAGFGKTTLLTQAVTENALAPLGQDCWLTCQRDDSALSFLGAGVLAALGVADHPVPDDPREAAIAVAEAMWARAPGHVALVLDDVHLLAPESPGQRFLLHLVEELPRNGHVVLASRPPLPLPTARRVASGDAVVVGEGDLQFADDELASFAASRDVSPDLLSDVGGWPALAELTASAGPNAVTGYVWEETLSQLSPERRRALAVLVAVGGADDAIASALLGPATHLAALLDGVPLVVRGRDGWWSLHGLWGAALQHALDAGQAAQVRRTAAAVLRQRRQYHEAMELLLDAAAWDDVRELVVDVCEVFTALVPADVLQGWLRRLPPDVQQTPEGLLLAAMAVEPSSPRAAERLLGQAMDAATQEPAASTGVRYALLNALVLLAFWQADRAAMVGLVERLGQLAVEGHPQAPGLIALLRAVLAPEPEQVAGELAVPELVPGAELSPVQEWLHAHLVLRRSGDPVGAEPLARAAVAHAGTTMRAQARCELIEALRLRGRLDEAAPLLPDLLAELDRPSVLVSPEMVTTAVGLLDLLGRHEQAEELLTSLRPALTASPVAWAPIATTVATAFHDLSVGREPSAAAALRALLPHGVARSRAVVQVSPAALPLLYVCVPELRARWDERPPPGCFAELHAAARALVALREQSSLAEAAGLGASARRGLRAWLPISWAAELAVALVAAGRADGRALLDDLGSPARATVRALTTSPLPAVAAAARALLKEIPAEPAYRLRLRVLGPLELLRDGVPVAAPELRRERVRQLLGHLLLHERPTRAGIAAALWPDLGEPAAARNLRVTLTYLQNVLEPDRDELDPPFFVRSSGPVLQLAGGSALEVDAHVFERLVNEAAALERQGALSVALVAYQQAVALWGGDYLVDVPDDDELSLERDRLRSRFVATAVRAGDLLLARGDAAAARALAEKALRSDPCSETAYRLLTGSYLAAGDLDSASRALRRCLLVLRDLGAPPGPATLALVRQLQAQGPGRAPPQRRPAALR